MDLVRLATRHLFFTGKGGVGKTSVACATAVGLADAGKRVLLVSTDPASNLDEVLGAALGTRPTAVPGVRGLCALNLDPEAAAHAYRERVVGPYRELLPPAAVRSMEEQLSGACTVEIAAFDEFARLLGEPAATAEFDHVLFDTAPTGHTLRLLTLPSAWTGFVEQSAFGTSCLGPLAGLEKQRALYEATVKALSDPARTTMVLVARPEPLRARRGGADERGARGARRPEPAPRGERRVRGPERRPGRDRARAAGPGRARGHARGAARAARARRCRSGPRALLGIDALRRIDAPVTRRPRPPPASPAPEPGLGAPRSTRSPRPRRGVILTMGKGGVGKTTVAAAIAVELARRGLRVHLSTTDPAAHVADAVGAPPPGLTVSRIDPAAETRAYTDEVLASVGPELDEKGRALLEEDLRSPCTEEVAVFRAFARTVAGGRGRVRRPRHGADRPHHPAARRGRVLPPRGAAPGEPHAGVGAAAAAAPARSGSSRACCSSRCPRRRRSTRRARCRRISRGPASRRSRWVVNQSLTPVATRDPVLAARRAAERPYLDEVASIAPRMAVVPWVAEPPRGAEALSALVGSRSPPVTPPAAARTRS